MCSSSGYEKFDRKISLCCQYSHVYLYVSINHDVLIQEIYLVSIYPFNNNVEPIHFCNKWIIFIPLTCFTKFSEHLHINVPAFNDTLKLIQHNESGKSTWENNKKSLVSHFSPNYFNNLEDSIREPFCGNLSQTELLSIWAFRFFA